MRFDCDCAQAGLIAGTVPTKGTLKRVRNSASASVEAVLQAMTTRSGSWSAIRPADDVDDARDQSAFRHVAIGEGGVVGDIDVICIGPRRRDLAIDGEAAEAGIEDENGWRRLRHQRLQASKSFLMRS